MKLVDYKGKYTIACDDDCVDSMDFIVGDITKAEIIADAKNRMEACEYYGIPVYVGNDKDLLKIFGYKQS